MDILPAINSEIYCVGGVDSDEWWTHFIQDEGYLLR